MRRLFLAADLHPAARDRIREIVEALQDGIRTSRRDRASSSPGCRRTTGTSPCTSSEGSTTGGSRPVLDVLTESLPVAPFDLELGRLGVFPPNGPPRVLWIGIAAGAESLGIVHHLLAERLGVGHRGEDRPFHAHVTLARVRSRIASLGAVLREIDSSVGMLTRVDHITLYESHLSSGGPRYEPLVRTRLDASPGPSERRFPEEDR